MPTQTWGIKMRKVEIYTLSVGEFWVVVKDEEGQKDESFETVTDALIFAEEEIRRHEKMRDEKSTFNSDAPAVFAKLFNL